MFAAIDRGRTGRIGFGAFVEWLLTMTHGGAEDRLRYVSYHIISYGTVFYCIELLLAPRTACGMYHIISYHIILYFIVLYYQVGPWPACGVTFDRDPRSRGGPIAADLCLLSYFVVILYCNIILYYVILQ